MLIKGLTSTNDAALPPGSLVTYEQDGSMLLAAVLNYKRPKFTVFNMRGREVALVAERLHKLPGAVPPDMMGTNASRQTFLSELHERASVRQQELNIGEIWELVRNEGVDYENGELCRLYLGKDELLEHLALRLALFADHIYFKRKKELFGPRPPETVEEIKKGEEARARKAKLRDAAMQALRDRIDGRDVPFPAETMPIVELIESVAVDAHHLDNNQKKEAKEMLTALCAEIGLAQSGNLPERAYDILVRSGHFNELTNPAVLRHRPALEFSAKALHEAAEIDVARCLKPPPARLDLRKLHCFTIDDDSTLDMDDALSLEQSADGYTLGIHIIDVASMVPHNSSLDLEVRRRATSIYCPDQNINMFPELLAEDKFSLLQDQERPCLSFIVNFDHNLEVRDSRIAASVIQVKERLNYEEVDRLLEQQRHDLSLIYNIAAGLEARRFGSGGFRVNKREVLVAPDPSGEIELIEVHEDAPSRALVAEMMVLANRLAAEFAGANEVPIVFRCQEEPAESDNYKELPPGPAQDYAIRSRLKKSYTAFRPARHATLGLDAYTQLTSPIRRYLDLVNQRQLLHFVETGKCFYRAEDLNRLCQETEDALGLAGAVSKESRKYWLLRWLQKYIGRDGRIGSTVIRTDLANPLVELDTIYLPCFARVNRKVKAGERLDLRIAAIDPRYDYIKLDAE